MSKVEALGERTIPGRRGMPAEGFLRHRGLIALAVCGAAVEAGLLTIVAPAARPLAPQVTAFVPLAVFHDLRWLFGYNRSYLGFALTFAALTVARAAVSAALIRLAWPHRLPRPAWRATLGRCTGYTVTASVLLSPVVALLFGVSVLPFSWPYLAALAAMLLIMIPLAHGGLLGSWWRTLPPVRAVGWLLASFVVLSLAAAAIARLPAPAAIAVAGLAGVVNARAWYGLAAAATRLEAPRPAPPGPGWLHAWEGVLGRPWARRWPAPVSPLAAITALALIICLTRLVMAGPAPQPGRPPAMTPQAAALTAGAGGPLAGSGGRAASPVLVIGGFGSSCCSPSAALRRIGPASLVQPFSYQGLDAAGRPLPYGHDDTNLPLAVLGDRIAAQLRRLHQRTGRPVSVVAESEGSLGVYAMLARHPDAAVRSVVLLSPIVDPGQAGHAPSADPAANPVSGDALKAMVGVAGALSPFGESGAQRLIGSVGTDGPGFAAKAARHGKRLRWLVVVPLADALTLPVCALPGDVVVVPALHGGLFGEAEVDRMIRGFLSGKRVAGPPGMRDAAEVIAAAAAAWRMPVTGTAPPACAR
jgi:hypothetical protein